MTQKTLWLGWGTTNTANIESASKLAHMINNAYVSGNLTGVNVFAAMGSSYNALPEWGYGPILADHPWDGSYKITPHWFTMAHTSQMSRPGWNHLNVGFGSGKLTNGGTYVTRVDTTSGQWLWSTVIAKMNNGGDDNIFPEFATFSLGGNIMDNSPAVYVYSSCFGATGTNVSFYQGPVTISPNGGQFTVFLDQNCLYSITNQAEAASWPQYPTPVIPTPFPPQGGDDFSSGSPGNPGMYWSDMNGAFEIVDDSSAGRGLQQLSMSKPITRRNTDTRPHTILGDPTWTDTDATFSFYLPSASDNAGFCVRCNSFNDTAGVDGSSGVDEMPGIWLFLSTTTWTLTFSLKPGTAPKAQGNLVLPFNPMEWHSVRLVARGDQVIGFLDGNILFRQNATFVNKDSSPPRWGFLGLAAGDFGQKPIFGAYSYSVLTTTCSATPQVGAQPHQEQCQPGTPGQQLAFVPGPGNPANGPGQFQLAADTTLCLHQNSTADPQYRYANTRAVLLQPCNATEPKQFFTIETTAVDGPANVGPVSGVDGLVVNVYGNSEADDSDISGYLWQGGTNAFWWWDASTGSLYANFMSSCLSFCTEL
jgi:hypothetical protein